MSTHKTAILICQGQVVSASYHAETGLSIIFARLPTVSSPKGASPVITPPGIQANLSCLPTNTRPNLSDSQRMKLLWHERLNHRSMSRINHFSARFAACGSIHCELS
jgi:hypothetical protein